MVLALALGLLPVASTPAAAIQAEADYYVYAGDTLSITIRLDSIGVQAWSSADSVDLADLLSGSGFRLGRHLGANHYVGWPANPLARSGLVASLRSLTAEGVASGLLHRAGLFTHLEGFIPEVFIADEFIAQFLPAIPRAAIDSINAANGVLVVREPDVVVNNFVLRVTERSEADAIRMAQRYDESALTEFAQPNFLFVAQPLSLPPDPLLSQQWHLHNDGSGVDDITGNPAKLDADIDAPEAWVLERGKASTVIAVIEVFGFDTTHMDLKDNLWLNAAEAGGTDGIDDGDPLQKVDDIRGWNFEGCPGLPSCGSNDVTNGGADLAHEAHANAVAGIAAAVTDNALGVSGVCPECSLLLIQSAGGSDATAEALKYAAEMGAAVINNSYTVPPDAQIRKHIQWVGEFGRGGLGSVVVWSACYPYFCKPLCSLSLPVYPHVLDSVIAVTQTTMRDEAIPFTNDPPIAGSCLDLAAPGRVIATTDNTDADGYNDQNKLTACSDDPSTHLDYTLCFLGTSAAAPVVSGVAGLVISRNSSLTAAQVKEILEQTADTIDTGNTDPVGKWTDTDGDGVVDFSDWYGHGRVNAHKALLATPGQVVADSCIEDPEQCQGRAADWEFGARAGLTVLRGPDDRTVVNGPGGGPMGDPVFHVAKVSGGGSWIYEAQIGGSSVDAVSGDRRSFVLAAQPAYQFGGGTAYYVGINAAYWYLDNAGTTDSDAALGLAWGVRFFPQPFLALRLEARYRRWFDQMADEVGLAVGFGVLVN